MTVDIEQLLSERLRTFSSAPFLFAGSGLSRRYLNLETWFDLLRKFSTPTGVEFEYFRSKADNYAPRIGSLIADRFFEAWWQSADYKESREKNKPLAISRASPLKIAVAEHVMLAAQNEFGKNHAGELELLRTIVVDGVITTNYDDLVERLFPDYTKYIGQENLLFSVTQGIAEIYKIHGCATAPNSLVLTEEDYDVFEKRNAYLAAKLLTIFVEHPVVFIGYSLSDRNVRQILAAIVNGLSTAKLNELRNRLIFVEYDLAGAGTLFEEFSLSFGEHQLLLTRIRTSDFSPIFRAMGGLERHLPAKILRQAKERIYELVLTNAPKSKLMVIGIEDAANLKDVDVVLGVGIVNKLHEKGYIGITAHDVVRDLLQDKSRFDDLDTLIDDVFPRLLKSSRKRLPVCRYLRNAGCLDDSGIKPGTKQLDQRIIDAATAPPQSFSDGNPYAYKQKNGRLEEYGGVADVIKKNENLTQALYLLPLLGPQQIDLNELRHFLVENVGLLDAGGNVSSLYFKLCCFYDRLAYGAKTM